MINKLIFAILFAIAAFVAFFAIYAVRNKSGCTKEITVKEILAFNYREVDVLTTEGETVTINQAKIKPGDKYCVASEIKF